MPRHATSTSYGGKAGNTPNTSTPGSGRPPDTFKMRMATLVERANTVGNIEQILDNPQHPSFMKALEFATDRAYGKPTDNKQLSGEVVVRVIRDDAPFPLDDT